MFDLIAGEWLKLRTTRLLYGTVPVAVLLSLAAVAGSVLATARTDIPQSAAWNGCCRSPAPGHWSCCWSAS